LAGETSLGSLCRKNLLHGGGGKLLVHKLGDPHSNARRDGLLNILQYRVHSLRGRVGKFHQTIVRLHFKLLLGFPILERASTHSPLANPCRQSNLHFQRETKEVSEFTTPPPPPPPPPSPPPVATPAVTTRAKVIPVQMGRERREKWQTLETRMLISLAASTTKSAYRSIL